MREIQFDLHGDGWTLKVIDELADVLHNPGDTFSLSPPDPDDCTLLPFKRSVLSGSAPA